MKDTNLNLKGGVLIIGSLLWQDYLSQDDNTIRRDWRNNHLKMKSKIKVTTPIRYGRRSGGDIYTMTFSNACKGKNIGTGFFVPFKNSNIKSFAMFLKEIHELSNAEGMNGNFVAGIRSPWSIVGIRFNDKKIKPAIKRRIIKWYSSQLENELTFDANTFKVGSESRCIKPNGVLNVPWLNAVEEKHNAKLDEYDFFLATATLPTKPRYPKIATLVTTVLRDNERQYFLNNYRHGITTFQDEKINTKLKSASK